MRIIISPAKKMRVDLDSLAPAGLPQFLPQTQQLLAALRAFTPQQLQALWKCNDSIAALNLQRLRGMDLCAQLTPAILSYEGIQYQYMAPTIFEEGQFRFIQQHLRILSGFYGLLRPFDGVTPYRLEMQAKLCVQGHKDLYAFWGSRLACALAQETDLVLDLASQEYSRAVRPHLPPSVRLLRCTFGQLAGNKVVEKGTLCKMARGQMVRYLAENSIADAEGVKGFCESGYRYEPAYSAQDHYVFIKRRASYA